MGGIFIYPLTGRQEKRSEIGYGETRGLYVVERHLCCKAAFPVPISSQIPAVRIDLTAFDLQCVAPAGLMLVQQYSTVDQAAAKPIFREKVKKDITVNGVVHMAIAVQIRIADGTISQQRCAFRFPDPPAGNTAVKIGLVKRIVPAKGGGTQNLMGVVIG